MLLTVITVIITITTTISVYDVLHYTPMDDERACKDGCGCLCQC